MPARCSSGCAESPVQASTRRVQSFWNRPRGSCRRTRSRKSAARGPRRTSPRSLTMNLPQWRRASTVSRASSSWASAATMSPGRGCQVKWKPTASRPGCGLGGVLDLDPAPELVEADHDLGVGAAVEGVAGAERTHRVGRGDQALQFGDIVRVLQLRGAVDDIACPVVHAPSLPPRATSVVASGMENPRGPVAVRLDQSRPAGSDGLCGFTVAPSASRTPWRLSGRPPHKSCRNTSVGPPPFLCASTVGRSGASDKRFFVSR